MEGISHLAVCMAAVFNYVSLVDCSYSSAIYVRQISYAPITANSSSVQLQSTLVHREDTCYIQCAQAQQCTSITYNTDAIECITYTGFLENPPSGAVNPSVLKYYIVKDASICASMGYTYEITLPLCYKIHYDQATLSEAKTICAGEGGRLIRIDSPAKQHVIKSINTEVESKYRIDGEFINGAWVFSSGLQISSFYWADGHPKIESKACLSVYFNTKNWKSLLCTASHRYICERVL